MNLRSPFLDSPRPALRRARIALRDWSSPLVNPFLAQSRRIDARGVRWPLTLLFIVALWFCALFAVQVFLRATRQQRDAANDGALLWIGIVWIVSWIMARLRDSELIRNEVLKGRFEPIQLLPISATRRAWLWSAPNSLWGILLAATMLPAVFWALGGGLMELREALLLIFLVVFSQWSVPLWTPTAWRMQTAKANESDKNPFKGLAMGNSRKAKMSDGLLLPPELAVSARGWGGGIGLMAPIWLMGQLGMAGAALGAAKTYWDGLPLYVRAPADEIYLNWPLFLVRWLGEAQPFFGFHLAPLVLLLPVWCAACVVRVLRLAAVTGREPFWTRAHLSLWKRAQTLQSALFFAFLLGALWPGAIENGAWLANWFGRLAGTPTQALAAWWIVCVAAGALAATAMWRAALELPVGALTLRAQAPRAAKLALRALAWSLAFWAGACLLGWRWPMSALWLKILPASLLVASVWIGAQCASWAAQRAPRFALAFTIWHALWFYGAPVGGAITLLIAQFPVKLLENFYPLSPWTLWLMLRDTSVGANPIFWRACGVHLSLALLTGGAAWLLGRDRIRASTPIEAPEGAALADELAPKPQPENAPALPPMTQAINLARKPLPAPDAWMARFLGWLERFDNPLLILEMRRAFTGNARSVVLALLVLQALSASVPLIILPVVGQVTGSWPIEMFTFFVALMLIIPTLIAILVMSGASLCYDRDRMDGTLELLFLTPRTSREIAWGKAGPFLLRAALMGVLWLPTLLLGAGLSLQTGQPLLVAAYAATPVWLSALCVRGVAGAHWMGLKKRKIGASNLSFAISLVVAFALISEAVALIAAFNLGAPFVVGAAILLGAIYVVEALMLWQRGVAALERWRLQGAPGAK